MMVDRRTLTVPRSWAVSVVVGLFAGIGTLVMIGIAVDRAIDKLNVLAGDVAGVAADAKRASEANNDILEAGRPCILDDPETPPDHPACVRAATSQAVVNKALGDIAIEDHRQHQHLVDVVAALVGKPAPQLPPPTTTTTTPRRTTATPRPAPRPPTAAPAPAPSLAPVTTQPATTTTSGCERLPNGKCKR